ncbi:MAG: hypothetical protein Q7S21_03455 [archaeon]|nr:hypothetical protein [archaeon]
MSVKIPKGKFIVPLVHSPENLSEYKQLILELKMAGITVIGLELPPKWKKKIKHGDVFFGPLARFAEKNGVRVIGVEGFSQLLANHVLSEAINFKGLLEWLEAKRKKPTKSEGQPTSVSFIENLFDSEKKKVLKKLELLLGLSAKESEVVIKRIMRLAATKDRASLFRLKQRARYLRDVHMSSEFQRHGLRVILVGGTHSEKISKKLGIQEYDYGNIRQNFDNYLNVQYEVGIELERRREMAYLKEKIAFERKQLAKIKPKLPK